MRTNPFIALLLLALPVLSACGDDEAAPPVLWNCVCRGAYADGGMPLSQSESIEHCSATDPTEMLSERYREAAEASGPAFTGSCEPCEATETPCTPEE